MCLQGEFWISKWKTGIFYWKNLVSNKWRTVYLFGYFSWRARNTILFLKSVSKLDIWITMGFLSFLTTMDAFSFLWTLLLIGAVFVVQRPIRIYRMVTKRRRGILHFPSRPTHPLWGHIHLVSLVCVSKVC